MVIINIIVYCVDQIVPDLAWGSPFKLASVSFNVFPSFFDHFITFWYCKIILGSFCTFPAQPWNQPFFQEAPVPFIGKWCLETRIWVHVYIGTGLWFLLEDFLEVRAGKIYVCIHICMHTSTTISIITFCIPPLLSLPPQCGYDMF